MLYIIYLFILEICLLFLCTSVLMLDVLKKHDKREIMNEVQSKETQKSDKVKAELSQLISIILVVLHQGANPADILATPALTDSPGGAWRRRQRRRRGLTDV